MGKRGELTDGVQSVAKLQMGREITQVELRLMPYVCDRKMHNRPVDFYPCRVTDDEISILQKWEREERITLKRDGHHEIEHHFWIAMQQIMYYAYVNPTALT